VVGRLIEMAHPKQIILFGSYARGKITEDSDLDVLIVAGDEAGAHSSSGRPLD
jgi:predicted nucleotidyltransferase